jgi:hypothetical protein
MKAAVIILPQNAATALDLVDDAGRGFAEEFADL